MNRRSLFSLFAALPFVPTVVKQRAEAGAMPPPQTARGELSIITHYGTAVKGEGRAYDRGQTYYTIDMPTDATEVYTVGGASGGSITSKTNESGVTVTKFGEGWRSATCYDKNGLCTSHVYKGPLGGGGGGH